MAYVSGMWILSGDVDGAIDCVHERGYSVHGDVPIDMEEGVGIPDGRVYIPGDIYGGIIVRRPKDIEFDLVVIRVSTCENETGVALLARPVACIRIVIVMIAA